MGRQPACARDRPGHRRPHGDGLRDRHRRLVLRRRVDDFGLLESVIGAVAGLGAFFALGPLFVLAGWFSTRSVARHGPAGFARSRLMRLGVPLVLFVVLVEPLSDYIGNRWDEPSRTFASYLRDTEVGAMWFFTALLCFSLVYALKEAVRPANAQPRPLRTKLLVAVGLAALFLLFGLSLAPDSGEKIALGLDVPTILFALLDGFIAAWFSLWFITRVRLRWPTHGPLLAKAGRASYATYFSHPLVVTLIMMSLAWVPLVPELKFLVVAPLAVVSCYVVGYALTRLPVVSEVL